MLAEDLNIANYKRQYACNDITTDVPSTILGLHLDETPTSNIRIRTVGTHHRRRLWILEGDYGYLLGVVVFCWCRAKQHSTHTHRKVQPGGDSGTLVKNTLVIEPCLFLPRPQV